MLRNFQKLAAGLDVLPLLHLIQRNPQLWNQFTLRSTHPDSPHRQVSDIWLRFQDLQPYESGDSVATIIDENESITYPAWNLLSPARVMVFDLMRRVEALRVGRVMITRLAPGKTIAAHVDGGAHAEYYDRYHIVLNGLPGSYFRCGDENVCMQTGEVWWFDNSIEHEVINNSAEDRVHLIVDLRL